MKMVQCPKCNFEQPDDQYCANCGVNMSSFEGPRLPWIKKFLKNWLGQFAILVSIILGLIIYDRISNPVKPFSKKSQELSYYKQVSQKDGEELPPENQASTENETESESTPEPTPAPSQESNPSTAAAQVDKKRELPLLFKRISVSFYELTPQQLEEIVKLSKEHSSEGESVLGVVDKDVFEKIVKSAPISEKNMKSLKTSDTRTLFIGKREREAPNGFGVFYDFTRLNQERESLLSLEIKSYYHLHLDAEEPSPLFRGEFTMSNSSLAYVSGLAPKGLQFTKSEKKIIEELNLLQKFFSPAVMDGTREIIMTVEPRR